MSEEKKIDDGGPAFGGAYDQVFVDTGGRVPPSMIEVRSQGMSLRDWFAGTAETIPATMNSETLAKHLGWPSPDIPQDDLHAWFLWWNRAEAAWKYATADAMIETRKKCSSPI